MHFFISPGNSRRTQLASNPRNDISGRVNSQLKMKAINEELMAKVHGKLQEVVSIGSSI
jgi:hypothetical protein